MSCLREEKGTVKKTKSEAKSFGEREKRKESSSTNKFACTQFGDEKAVINPRTSKRPPAARNTHTIKSAQKEEKNVERRRENEIRYRRRENPICHTPQSRFSKRLRNLCLPPSFVSWFIRLALGIKSLHKEKGRCGNEKRWRCWPPSSTL